MLKLANYRLALILPHSRQILASVASGVAMLPTLDIPKWQRPVEQLTRIVNRTWNIRAIVLDLIPCNPASNPCAVLEVLTPKWRYADHGFCAVAPEDIGAISLFDEERPHLKAILDDNDVALPLSRLGWMDEAQRWIQACVRDCSLRFNGEIQQLQAGGNFALVRFGTVQGRCYWLKATGFPNVHEFTVTKTLARYFPQFLPPLVATREDWNAWVMEDAGEALRGRKTVTAFEQTVHGLSALQRQSIPHTKALLDAGCADRSLVVLQSHLDELIDYLAVAMERQISTKATPLDKRQLRNLRSALSNVCRRMQDLQIPDALIHLDINPGNILFNGNRSVFIDWAEAGIGNPLLTFEHLAAHLARGGDPAEGWLPALRAQYRMQWLDLLTESKIDQAFALSPLLAVAMYLYGRGDWLRSPLRDDCDFQAYARSLARHMYRRALAPGLMEAA